MDSRNWREKQTKRLTVATTAMPVERRDKNVLNQVGKNLIGKIVAYVENGKPMPIREQLDTIRRRLFMIMIDGKDANALQAAKTLLVSYQIAKNVGIDELFEQAVSEVKGNGNE